MYSPNVYPLIYSTVLSVLSVHSSIIERQIFKWLNKQTAKERELWLERTKLKAEQLQISMVDQFAKYSKIQRKINGIDEELKTIMGSKSANNVLVRLGFSYGVKFFLGVVIIVLSIYYRNTPVFYLGDQINLLPFTNLICYPNEANYVSFYFWVLCCAAVAQLFQKNTT